MVEVGGHHYALIGSTSNDGIRTGLTIIDITDPASLSYVANVTTKPDGKPLFRVLDVASAQVDGRHYALLGTLNDITIIDITDPASPSTVAILVGEEPLPFSSPFNFGRDTVTTGGRHYVPVAVVWVVSGSPCSTSPILPTLPSAEPAARRYSTSLKIPLKRT